MIKNPYVALFVGVIAISIFPVIVKVGLNTPLESAFYRMSIAAAILMPYAYFSGKLHFNSGRNLLLSVLCGCIFGVDISVWNIAIAGSGATQASLLTNLSPVWVGVFSFLFLHNKPKKIFWAGMSVAMLGVVIYIGADTFRNMSFDKYFLFGTLSGLCYSTYILISKGILLKDEVVAFVAVSSFSSSVLIFVSNYVQGEHFWGFDALQWSALIFQGVVCQLVAWLCISYATQFIPATRVSLILLSQAVFAGLFSYMFIGEEISLQNVIGGIFILLGIGITIKK